MYLKVLLITATPVRTDTNIGKTLLALFSDFHKDELCQLYFSPETSNVDACNSYYQICEKQMLKSFFGLRKTRCGGEVRASLDGRHATVPEKNSLMFTRRKGKVYMRIIREAVWGLTNWKNVSFKQWLEKEKPNVIFTIMHDTNEAAKAVKWIADQYHIPVVMYITDDYYHDPDDSRNIIRKYYYNKRQKINRQLGTVCKFVIGCSQKAVDYFADTLKILMGGGTLYSIGKCLFSVAI